jgi:hypothetical protein
MKFVVSRDVFRVFLFARCDGGVFSFSLEHINNQETTVEEQNRKITMRGHYQQANKKIYPHTGSSKDVLKLTPFFVVVVLLF